MPIVLIIVGLAVAVGVGSYFFRPTESVNQQTDVIVEVPTEEAIIEVPTEEPAVTTPEPEPAAVTENRPEVTPTTPTTPTTPAVTTVYENGAHSATAPYTAPGNARHNVAVTLTLQNDIVTAASVTYSGDKVDTSTNYQNRFSNAYQAQVIGKKLDAISLSRVGGASLTSNAFNNAINQIKASAKN